MLGRGIDQVMAHPCNPTLHEGYAQSAIDYVRLAEEANGPIPRKVGPSYVWGAALEALKDSRPDARIINLETSITHSEDFLPKGINYRMSPENTDCLVAAEIDCCVLANNHILDWGPTGLIDTLGFLRALRIKTAGAGRTSAEASAPAILNIAGNRRLLVFSFASVTSGTPRTWAARPNSPGVNLLADFSDANIARICEQIALVREPHDVVVASLHWGSNWGYEIPAEQRRFAHALVDKAAVCVIHGHSSHHIKAIELYRKRLILYGCGDFLNDYEGIRGYEEYRDDLSLAYLVDIDPGSADVVALEIVPLHIRKFRLNKPSQQDVDWVQKVLNRESQKFGVDVVRSGRDACLLAARVTGESAAPQAER
jgi:poly-gamma-glutamate synthesis protein (capsule biosynthesis protein)